MTMEDVTPVKLSMMLGAARLPWRSLWKVNNYLDGLDGHADIRITSRGLIALIALILFIIKQSLQYVLLSFFLGA